VVKKCSRSSNTHKVNREITCGHSLNFTKMINMLMLSFAFTFGWDAANAGLRHA
jgi:hypothetical protein